MLLTLLFMGAVALAQEPVFFHGYLNDSVISSAWHNALATAFNHVSLAGWRSDGVTGAAASFASLNSSARSSILADFHEAGKTLRVSAFGDNDTPTTSSKNATAVAQALASFTLENGLDGLDVAYADDAAVESGSAQGWLETFHDQLLLHLAPPFSATTPNSTLTPPNATQSANTTQAPNKFELTYSLPASYFRPGTSGSLFYAFLTPRASSISKLIVHFYDSQGLYNYTTWGELFGYADSGAVWKSRKQIAELLGWDEGRIVVQKPTDPRAAGYLAPEDLGKAFCQAGAKVEALSLWTVDEGEVADAYLDRVRGYQCRSREGSWLEYLRLWG